MSIYVRACLGFIVALVLLLALSFVSKYALHRSLDGAVLVWHTDEVLMNVEGLSADLRIAELYERDFLITGEQAQESAFHGAQAQVIEDLERLRGLTLNNALEQQRLNYLEQLAARLLTITARAVAERQKNGKTSGTIYSRAFRSSQESLQQIRTYSEKITTEEERFRRERSNAVKSNSHIAISMLDTGTILAIIVVVLSALVTIHGLRRREKTEIALLDIQKTLEARIEERTEELSDMAARYRLLFEDSPLPIVVFDAETLQFLAVNAAAKKLYGYTCEEFLGMCVRDIHAAENGSTQIEVLNTIQPVDAFRTQLRTQRKDGRLLTIDARVRTIDFGERPAQMALLTDVTDQMHFEAQLPQSQKMEFIGQFAGGVAHDFNNLLIVILGYSDLILRKLEWNHPLRSKVSEIQAAGQRAANLTRQLLAFSRKQMLHPEVLNLNAVVNNICQALQSLLTEDIELILHLKSDIGQVRADPTQLEQVLMNLAVNARDAMPAGGQLTIETQNVVFDHCAARLHGVPPRRYVMLAVSDTGCGMDAATKERIFEPFFTTKDVGKGTGLGLSLVFGVIQQSGGTVTVYSELGVGSTFKIYLPVIDTPRRAEGMEQRSLVSAANSTILLVEDEDPVRVWAAEVLREAGCRVLEASNGQEALEIAEKCPNVPTLLLTDVVMPGMNGPELAHSLLRKWPGLFVIYASGYTEHTLLSRRVLEQDMRFLQKPYSADALLEHVARVQVA